MLKLRAKTVCLIAAAGAMVTTLMPASGQEGRILDPQQTAATIDCRQWTLNSDGTRSSGPKARIGNLTFSNTMNNTMSG